ncbi:MAG: Na+/H+ antiporter subunit E [Pseudomonadota bacterium]
MRIAGLVGCLAAFWLALSGHYTAFLVFMGVLSVAAVVVFAERLEITDREAQPFWLLARAVTYWPWLLLEIFKSAISVSRIILSPSLPISPTMTTVTGSQATGAGLATYGNSITLTPGTITTDVDGDVLTIHALTDEGARDLEAGGMDRRVVEFEGQS